MKLYDDLEINPTATKQQIKAAYRKKSAVVHPDKPTGDQNCFLKINRAYTILMCEETREQYDTLGVEDTADEITKQAESSIQQTFFNILRTKGPKEILQVNVIMMIKQGIQAKIAETKLKQDENSVTIRDMIEVGNRITHKNENNMFSLVVKQEIKNCEENKDRLTRVMLIHKRAAILLDDYVFKQDEGLVRTNMYANMSSTSNTFSY
jgi:DnaJ-class molecular chaperone